MVNLQFCQNTYYSRTNTKVLSQNVDIFHQNFALNNNKKCKGMSKQNKKGGNTKSQIKKEGEAKRKKMKALIKIGTSDKKSQKVIKNE